MKIYVAGPYTNGDVARNIRAVIQAADRIAEAGHMPFVPHLYHFWHLVIPHEYEFWTRLDRFWLVQCNVLVRIGGDSLSTGADDDEELALEWEMEIFYSVDSFLKKYPKP